MGHTISGAAGGGAVGGGVAGPRPLGSATRAALLPSVSTLPSSPHSLYSNREAPTSLRSRRRFDPCGLVPPPTKRAAPEGAALREWTGVASMISKDQKLRPAVGAVTRVFPGVRLSTAQGWGQQVPDPLFLYKGDALAFKRQCVLGSIFFEEPNAWTAGGNSENSHQLVAESMAASARSAIEASCRCTSASSSSIRLNPSS